MYQSAKELAFKAQRKVGDIIENSTGAIVGSVGLGVSVVSGFAQAALPASVATTMTGIETNVQDMFDAVFPIVALGLGLVIVIKLFKRFGNKI